MLLRSGSVNESVNKSTSATASGTLETLSDRVARKAASICVRVGCQVSAAEDADECPRHRDERRERVRRSMRKRRSRFASRKRCTGCGREPRPGLKLCRVCNPESESVNNLVNKAARVAANTTPRTTASNLGRVHYHGKGKRGAMTKAECDARDLDEAIKRLVRAKALLEYASSPEVAQLPRIQREDAMANAVAEAMLGVRHGLEVGVRHKQPVGLYAERAGKDE